MNIQKLVTSATFSVFMLCGLSHAAANDLRSVRSDAKLSLRRIETAAEISFSSRPAVTSAGLLKAAKRNKYVLEALNSLFISDGQPTIETSSRSGFVIGQIQTVNKIVFAIDKIRCSMNPTPETFIAEPIKLSADTAALMADRRNHLGNFRRAYKIVQRGVVIANGEATKARLAIKIASMENRISNRMISREERVNLKKSVEELRFLSKAIDSAITKLLEASVKICG